MSTAPLTTPMRQALQRLRDGGGQAFLVHPVAKGLSRRGLVKLSDIRYAPPHAFAATEFFCTLTGAGREAITLLLAALDVCQVSKKLGQ